MCSRLALAFLTFLFAVFVPRVDVYATVVDWEALPLPHGSPWPETIEGIEVAPSGDLWVVSRRPTVNIWSYPYDFLFKSADSGDTWTSFTVRGAATTAGLGVVAVDPACLAVDSWGRVCLGNNAGLFLFDPISDIWTTTTVTRTVLCLKRVFDGTLYASGGFYLVHLSEETGAWETVFPNVAPPGFAQAPNGSFYGVSDWVDVSTDGLSTWQRLFRLWGPSTMISFDTISFAGASPAGSVFVANQQDYTMWTPHLLRLPPGGQTWEPLLIGRDPWSSVVSSADGILACSLRTRPRPYPGSVDIYVSAVDGAYWMALPCVLGDAAGRGYATTALAMSPDGTIYAGFQGNLARFRMGGAYAIMTLADAGGAIQEVPLGAFHTAGSTITLTAMPSGAYTFTGWEGDTGLTTETAATTNPIVVVMDRHRFVRAHFSLGTFAVTALTGPGGTVTRQPDQALYDAGSAVTITATPDRGFRFRRWFGDIPLGRSLENPLILTVDTTRTLTGQFGPNGSNWIMLW